MVYLEFIRLRTLYVDTKIKFLRRRLQDVHVWSDDEMTKTRIFRYEYKNPECRVYGPTVWTIKYCNTSSIFWRKLLGNFYNIFTCNIGWLGTPHSLNYFENESDLGLQLGELCPFWTLFQDFESRVMLAVGSNINQIVIKQSNDWFFLLNLMPSLSLIVF